jgi:hypothetical protein
MKKLFVTIGLALLCVSVKAQSPIYAPQTLGTFTCAASTATNLNYVVSCGKQANVAVAITTTNTLAEAGGVQGMNLVYARSVDGTYYETNQGIWGIVGKGTNINTVITNLPTQGAGYIKFWYGTNSNGGTTNVGWAVMSYGVKISAP